MDRRDHFVKLAQVEAREPYILELTYADGVRVVVDISPTIEPDTVFEALRDGALFSQVAIREGGYALEWPNGLDLDGPALRMPGQWHHILEYLDPVAEEVARIIEESGLSLREIARRMNVSHPNLVRWSDPSYGSHSVNTLRRLANALGYKLVMRFEKIAGSSSSHQHQKLVGKG